MEFLQHWLWDTSKFPNFGTVTSHKSGVSRSCFASFTWWGGPCPRGGITRILLMASQKSGKLTSWVNGSLPHDLQGLGYISRWLFGISEPSTVSWYHDLWCFFLGWWWWWFLGPEGARWVKKDMSWPRQLGPRGHLIRRLWTGSIYTWWMFPLDEHEKWPDFLKNYILCESFWYYFVLFLLFLPCDSWQIISLFNTE